MTVTWIETALLDEVSSHAKASDRQRKNYNFHAHDAAICHRLLNAIEPDSYVPPHKHLSEEKSEAIVLLRGRLAVFIFDDEGRVTAHKILDPDQGVYGLDIPSGVFHTVIALKPNTVFFEAKAGPYVPPTENEFARFAPKPGEAGVHEYQQKLLSLLASP